MAKVAKEGIGPIIISQNNREEIRLTLRHCNGLSFVDLRMYALDQQRGKAVPTEKGTTINVKLWPQFRTAVSSLEPCIGALPVRDQQMTHNRGLGRSIFPSSAALRKNLQEQIYLEQKDFRGITFIMFKTLVLSKRGRPRRTRRLITIGPVLWHQFMKALNIMEALLISLGFLSEEVIMEESGFEQLLA